jgi:hypothetical protein
MFCLKCGKKIPDESNYCLYCGVFLSENNGNSLVKGGRGKALVDINCKKDFNWLFYKIKIFVDGDLIKTIKNGGSACFEIDNGKHIIFCEASMCKRSEVIEIIANSNKINFYVAFPPAFTTLDYSLTLTKTKETDAGTWE